MNYEKNSCETQEQTIIRLIKENNKLHEEIIIKEIMTEGHSKGHEETITKLTEENNKLHEEIKILSNKLIVYNNMLKHIEYSVKSTVDQVRDDIFQKKKIKNESESEEIIMNKNRYDLKQMEFDANSMSRKAFKAKYMENFDNCLKAGEDYANLMEIASQLGIKDPQSIANKASKEDIERWHATING
jgi:hypothetical protein